MKTTFNPHIKKIGSIKTPISIDEIENEVMLFSASIDFAKENGGKLKLTMEILANV